MLDRDNRFSIRIALVIFRNSSVWFADNWLPARSSGRLNTQITKWLSIPGGADAGGGVRIKFSHVSKYWNGFRIKFSPCTEALEWFCLPLVGKVRTGCKTPPPHSKVVHVIKICSHELPVTPIVNQYIKNFTSKLFISD